MPAVESIRAFAKRTGLTEDLVRALAKQGKLPHIMAGTTHIRIHIEAGLRSLEQLATATAAEKAAVMPVPFIPAPRPEPPKFRGRIPDKVRLGLMGQQ